MTRFSTLAAASALMAAVLLSGCAKKSVDAPTDVGVCWHAVFFKDGTVKFNKLAENQKNLETCAASLEAMRLRFRGLGVNSEQTIGAYQGQWLFLQSEGVLTSQTLTGGRYVALVRTGDGRLAIPGAMPK